MKRFINKHKETIKSYLTVTLGTMIVAFACSFFLNPNHLDIGGASGSGVIINFLNPNIRAGFASLLINLGLLVLSLIFVGKQFFIKTAYGAISCGLLTWLFDVLYELLVKSVPKLDMTKVNPVIVILFSSIIMGYGLGIAFKNGGSTGGTEIPQKIFYKSFHIPYAMSLYMVDGLVILAGVFLMDQGVETLLLEIIFAVVSGFIMDTTIFSGFNKRAVYIISDKHLEIRNVLLNDFVRGVTSIKVVGEYSNTDKKMLFCVLSSFEYNKLRDIIEGIDPKAFFFCMRASEVRGEGFTYELENGKNITKNF